MLQLPSPLKAFFSKGHFLDCTSSRILFASVHLFRYVGVQWGPDNIICMSLPCSKSLSPKMRQLASIWMLCWFSTLYISEHASRIWIANSFHPFLSVLVFSTCCLLDFVHWKRLFCRLSPLKSCCLKYRKTEHAFANKVPLSALSAGRHMWMTTAVSGKAEHEKGFCTLHTWIYLNQISWTSDVFPIHQPNCSSLPWYISDAQSDSIWKDHVSSLWGRISINQTKLSHCCFFFLKEEMIVLRIASHCLAVLRRFARLFKAVRLIRSVHMASQQPWILRRTWFLKDQPDNTIRFLLFSFSLLSALSFKQPGFAWLLCHTRFLKNDFVFRRRSWDSQEPMGSSTKSKGSSQHQRPARPRKGRHKSTQILILCTWKGNKVWQHGPIWTSRTEQWNNFAAMWDFPPSWNELWSNRGQWKWWTAPWLCPWNSSRLKKHHETFLFFCLFSPQNVFRNIFNFSVYWCFKICAVSPSSSAGLSQDLVEVAPSTGPRR